jgi:hypothetical protein
VVSGQNKGVALCVLPDTHVIAFPHARSALAFESWHARGVQQDGLANTERRSATMKFQTLALAAAVSLGGLAAGQAFAQERDVTVTHETPSGDVVTRHVHAGDGADGPVVHRSTRIVHPDGSVEWRRTTRITHYAPVEPARAHRTVVIHRHFDPETGQMVVTRTVRRDVD